MVLGLAPVRSSRQDQIHASIVATLLALMDGMDGRGLFPSKPPVYISSLDSLQGR